MTDQEKYMRRALELALSNRSLLNGGPFGAVIVKDGRIIAESVNTVVKDNDPTAHAEVNVIREACSVLGTYQLDGCDIYSSCEPCPMCLGALYWARTDRIFYAAERADAEKAGFDDSHIYHEICKPVNDRIIPMRQVLVQEGKDVFRLWKEANLNIEY